MDSYNGLTRIPPKSYDSSSTNVSSQGQPQHHHQHLHQQYSFRYPPQHSPQQYSSAWYPPSSALSHASNMTWFSDYGSSSRHQRIDYPQHAYRHSRNLRSYNAVHPNARNYPDFSETAFQGGHSLKAYREWTTIQSTPSHSRNHTSYQSTQCQLQSGWQQGFTAMSPCTKANVSTSESLNVIPKDWCYVTKTGTYEEAVAMTRQFMPEIDGVTYEAERDGYLIIVTLSGYGYRNMFYERLDAVFHRKFQSYRDYVEDPMSLYINGEFSYDISDIEKYFRLFDNDSFAERFHEGELRIIFKSLQGVLRVKKELKHKILNRKVYLDFDLNCPPEAFCFSTGSLADKSFDDTVVLEATSHANPPIADNATEINIPENSSLAAKPVEDFNEINDHYENIELNSSRLKKKSSEYQHSHIVSVSPEEDNESRFSRKNAESRLIADLENTQLKNVPTKKLLNDLDEVIHSDSIFIFKKSKNDLSNSLNKSAKLEEALINDDEWSEEESIKEKVLQSKTKNDRGKDAKSDTPRSDSSGYDRNLYFQYHSKHEFSTQDIDSNFLILRNVFVDSCETSVKEFCEDVRSILEERDAKISHISYRNETRECCLRFDIKEDVIMSIGLFHGFKYKKKTNPTILAVLCDRLYGQKQIEYADFTVPMHELIESD